MIEEEKRAIESLQKILNDLLARNINIYGAAIANPSGHIVTSDFQSEKPGFPLDPQQLEDDEKEKQKIANEVEASEDKKEEQIPSEENSDIKPVEPEEQEESEKWTVDKSGIFVLAFSYGMMAEVIEKIGEFLGKGKIKSMYIKSTYSNLVIIPVTPMINLLMIITSGKGFNFSFFRDFLNRDIEDIEEENQETKLDEATDDEDTIDQFFYSLRDELPGLLGAGHVGIKEKFGSYQLFGSFKQEKPDPENKSKNSSQGEKFIDMAANLSYLFYIGQRLIEEERNLEFDLIQLQYEKGHVLLKPHRDIAFIFDTTEPFNHTMVDPNLPPPQEFEQILQKIKITANGIKETHEKIKIWVEKGVELLQKNQPEKALEYFTKALEIKPEDTDRADHWYMIGRALGDLAKYREAVACFKQVHKEDPTHIDSWKKQAKAHYYEEQGKKAIKCLIEATKLDGTQDEVFIQIAALYDELKKPRRAIQFYKKGLKLNTNQKSAWFGIAHSYFDVKRYKKAISCYEKILEIEKENCAAWIGIGWAFNKLKKYHKSIECFDIAISMDPNSAVAWNNRGACFYRLKNYEEAMNCYEKSMKLDPLLQYPWSNIGTINEKYGNYQIAVDYTERAHDIDPKDRDYIRDLRKWKPKLKRAKRKFLRKLSKISKMNPKIPMTDLNDRLQIHIKPLLKKRTKLEDLLRHLIGTNQLKAKITEDYLEFV